MEILETIGNRMSVTNVNKAHLSCSEDSKMSDPENTNVGQVHLGGQ
jgi:hypothetical protein